MFFIRYVKGVPFFNEGYTNRKGYLFGDKWYIKGYGVGPRGGASLYSFPPTHKKIGLDNCHKMIHVH